MSPYLLYVPLFTLCPYPFCYKYRKTYTKIHTKTHAQKHTKHTKIHKNTYKSLRFHPLVCGLFIIISSAKSALLPPLPKRQTLTSPKQPQRQTLPPTTPVKRPKPALSPHHSDFTYFHIYFIFHNTTLSARMRELSHIYFITISIFIS